MNDTAQEVKILRMEDSPTDVENIKAKDAGRMAGLGERNTLADRTGLSTVVEMSWFSSFSVTAPCGKAAARMFHYDSLIWADIATSCHNKINSRYIGQSSRSNHDIVQPCSHMTIRS